MKIGLLVLLFVAALAGCAAAPDREPSAIAENDPIADYIQVAQLQQVDAVRSFEQLQHRVISEDYIIIYDRRKSHLATFRRPCRELYDEEITPDVRYDGNTIRARFDTIRGCRIEALYEISAGQAEELIQLGEASGK